MIIFIFNDNLCTNSSEILFQKWDYDPVIPFGVVIEDPAHTEQPFLTDAFYQNSSSEIPFMVGVNSEEGLFKAVGNSFLTSKLLEIFITFIFFC